MAAAPEDREVARPFKPVTGKDTFSPEVCTRHVSFGSCTLKGVDVCGGRVADRGSAVAAASPGRSTGLPGFQERLHLHSFRRANGATYHLCL